MGRVLGALRVILERVVNTALVLILALCTIAALAFTGEAIDRGDTGLVVLGILFIAGAVSGIAFFGRDLLHPPTERSHNPAAQDHGARPRPRTPAGESGSVELPPYLDRLEHPDGRPVLPEVWVRGERVIPRTRVYVVDDEREAS